MAAKKQTRSRNYPYLTLRDAFDLCRKIFDAEGTAKVSKERLSGIFGIKTTSSGYLRKIAALKTYGLIKEVGQGLYEISEVFIDFLDPSTKYKSVEKAFLAPRAYRDIYDEIGGGNPPSEENLIYMLLRKGFSKDGAKLTSKNFLESLAFFESFERGSGSVKPAVEEGNGIKPLPTRIRRAPSRDREEGYYVQEIPLLGFGRMARIELPYDFTGTDIELVINVLEVYRERKENETDA